MMEKLEFKKYQISLNDCLAESAGGVLIGIDGKKAVWIDKKYLFKCDFCLKANISIVAQWTYKVIDLKDNNKYEIVKWEKLIKLFNELKKDFFIKK